MRGTIVSAIFGRLIIFRRLKMRLQPLLLFGALLMVASNLSAEVNRQAIIGAAVENWQSEDFQPLDKAIASFKQGDFRTTLATLTELKRGQPQLPPPRVMLAQMLFGVGEVQSGRQTLEEAVVTNPDDAEPYVILGELDLREQRLTAAALQLEQAVRLLTSQDAPSDYRHRQLAANAYNGATATALARGQTEQALRLADAWLATIPNSPTAHTRKGEILFSRGDYAGAYAAFQRSEKHSAESLPAEISMALLYEQLAIAGDVAKRENAQRAMDQAVRDAADQIEVRLIAANWGLEAGRLQFAEEQATAALKLQPKSIDVIAVAGRIDRAAGRYEAALTRYRTILEIRPADPLALREMAISCGVSQQQQALAVEYAKLVHAFERSQASNILLAWAWLKSGQLEQAAAQLGREHRGQLDHETMSLAGEVLSQLGRKDEAIAVLTEATSGHEFYPAKPAAFALLAKLLKN